MRFVFPGQEALEVLERAGTTKDECTARLEQILASEQVQLSVFGTRVSPETIELSDDPNQQGGFNFTYFISIRDNSEERRFVAQFREDSIERTSLDILNAAEAVFGSYVAKPLFISMENKLQFTIWEYYGENMQHKFIYDKFTHEQKKTAMRQYATFLALGCRDGTTDTPSNSKVYETFERLATWNFSPSFANIILALNASLDDLRQLPVVTMHRDHGFHNLLCTSDGIITKVIDWGTELSYEPLGVSLGRIEQYVKDSLELRQEFWDCFIAATRPFLNPFPEIKSAIKTAKDGGICDFHAQVLPRSDSSDGLPVESPGGYAPQ